MEIESNVRTLLDTLSLTDFSFCILPVRSVGVQGDNRSYKASVCIFAPVTIHLLTEHHWNSIWRAAEMIPNGVTDINRVVLSLTETSKAYVTPHPFQINDTYVTMKRADTLRSADQIVSTLISEFNLYDQIWQFPVVLLPLGRRKGTESVVLRPVDSAEAMTASASRLPTEFLTRANEMIIGIEGIDSVFYDLTSKPPGTIEWE
jgi:GMP synthase (glutamine-hydrolysing)